MNKTIIVSGMSCGHCVKRVENALLGIEGVVSVVVNLVDKSVVIESNTDIDDNHLKEVISDAGYEIESM